MSSDLNNVYAIQGVSYASVDVLHTITRAKQRATKQSKAVITLNGKPFGTVDHKGIFKPA